MKCSMPAFLSFTVFWSFLKLISIDLVMPLNHLILCRPLLLLSSIFPGIKVLSSESALHIRWPKYQSFSFSISPSNEYSRLISFRIDGYDLFYPKVTQESSLVSQFKNISYLMFSLLYGPTVTSIQDHQKNRSFDYTDLFWQSDVFAFQELILLPVVLDKTLKSPLDCKEIKLCNSKGNQS